MQRDSIASLRFHLRCIFCLLSIIWTTAQSAGFYCPFLTVKFFTKQNLGWPEIGVLRNSCPLISYFCGNWKIAETSRTSKGNAVMCITYDFPFIVPVRDRSGPILNRFENFQNLSVFFPNSWKFALFSVSSLVFAHSRKKYISCFFAPCG